MRSMRLGRLWAVAAALGVIAPLTFGAARVHAQTMGEYGTTVGNAGTVATSSSTLQPPAVHPNPIGDGSSTSAVEVGNHATREDDSPNYRDDREDRDSGDAESGDEWSPSR